MTPIMGPLEGQVPDVGPILAHDQPDGIPAPVVRVLQASLQHFPIGLPEPRVAL